MDGTLGFAIRKDQAWGEVPGQVFPGAAVASGREGEPAAWPGESDGRRGLRDSAYLIEVRSDERWFPRLRIGAGRPTFLFLGRHAKGSGALASKLGSGPGPASLLP